MNHPGPPAPSRPAGRTSASGPERGDHPAWLPALSLVAVTPAGEVIGHVLGSRGHVGRDPVLAVGPLAVRPDRQQNGVGSALMHAILGAADALGEPLAALLGDPGYYRRFGFELSTVYQITPPRPEWQPHFQVRVLSAIPAPAARHVHLPRTLRPDLRRATRSAGVIGGTVALPGA